MKFAFVINVFREDDFHSGGEKLFYELVNRSIQEGFKVDLYCTTYLGNKDIVRDKLNKITFLGKPKDFKYPEKIEAFYREVNTLTDKEGYDFVISENIAPHIDIGILQGHSLAHYQKNAGNLFARLLFSLKKGKFIKAQKEWLKRDYRKIIVPSEVLKKELQENFGIPEEKFAVIHPGVDLPENCSVTPAGKPFVFGLSAPSFAKKGGYVFLKALGLLKTKGYDFRAKVIYPKYKNNLKLQFLLRKYGLTNQVEFLSYQADMNEFYGSIDCIVLPSVLETFGLVATEAMIRYKPAIISSFSGASEIISPTQNGFVFDMTGKNYKNLAEKMEFFLNGQTNYEEISQNAHETASQLNWQDFYEKFKASFLTYPLI